MGITDDLRDAWVSARDTFEIYFTLTETRDGDELTPEQQVTDGLYSANTVDLAGYGCQRTAVGGRFDPDTGDLWGKSVK